MKPQPMELTAWSGEEFRINGEKRARTMRLIATYNQSRYPQREMNHRIVDARRGT
jgi:hypothetical protein